jgi:anthranilate/para-aminobenzoate synthase component I
VTAVRVIAAPPDPLALARALAGRPGLAVLASRPSGAPRPGDARCSFVACDPVDESEDLVPPAADRGLLHAPAWIGVVPYEAVRGIERPGWTRGPDERPGVAFTRPAWRRYGAVARIDHVTGRVEVVGDDARAVDVFARRIDGAPPRSAGRFTLRLAAGEPDEAHLERVRAALALIAAGDLYEVNLARRIPFDFHGDALSLFTSLLDAAPAPWSFFQDLGQACAIATSPELALSVRGELMRSCPIKGTRPRGGTPEEDERMAAELDADPKERAELTMAIDVHRNDLGRVAAPGSVRVLGEPRVLGGRTVWSRVAEVVARRAPGVTLSEVAQAVLPCGSVTGAPKVRAMEVIAHLEPSRRGLYTGAFGYVGRGGQLELAMAIRTVQLSRAAGGGEYFAGGGIVADSVPERELAETRWKAAQLQQLAAS